MPDRRFGGLAAMDGSGVSVETQATHRFCGGHPHGRVPASGIVAVMSGRPPEPSSETYPFLFLGAGFGTSRKNLGCHICFARPPSADERPAIEELLPPALTNVKSWAPAMLTFASDDILEARVSSRRGRPTRADWIAFCEDVERRVIEIHRVCPIALFVKDDDGEYGGTLGPWHFWSVRELGTRFRGLAISSEASPELGSLCSSVLSMLATSAPMTGALDPAVLRQLFEWGLKIAAVDEDWCARRIVRALVSLLPVDGPLGPELAGMLVRNPTRQLIDRWGFHVVADRGLALLSSATPDNAEKILDASMRLMFLHQRAGRVIGRALLRAEPMKTVVEERSARVRQGSATGTPLGKTSPSQVLAVTGHLLLVTRRPKRALASIELGLRFPHPVPKLYGLRVRALQKAGHPARAEEAARSDAVDQAGVEDPDVFVDAARYYVGLGRLTEAVDQLRRIAPR